MRHDLDSRRSEIVSWLIAGVTRAEVCRRLGCKYETLKLRLTKWDVLHLKNQGAKGQKSDPKKKSAKEYLQSTCIKTHKLKNKLIADGIKEYRCEKCKNTEWNGEPIPLELDHKDGNRFNNSLDNIWILCPNCHAQQPTNSGKNWGRYTAG